MILKVLPIRVVAPGRIQAAHIGLEGGLHEGSVNSQKRTMLQHYGELEEFHVKINEETRRVTNVNNKVQKKGFGGWGHPADHEHCLMLFSQKEEKVEQGKKKKWSIF
jgi:hypothetical protein